MANWFAVLLLRRLGHVFVRGLGLSACFFRATWWLYCCIPNFWTHPCMPEPEMVHVFIHEQCKTISCAMFAYLVGGLEHFLFSIIYGIILPIDEYVSEGLKPPTRYVCNLLWVALRLQNGHQGHEVKSLQQDMRGKGNSKSHRPLSIAPWSWSCIDCR